MSALVVANCKIQRCKQMDVKYNFGFLMCACVYGEDIELVGSGETSRAMTCPHNATKHFSKSTRHVLLKAVTFQFQVHSLSLYNINDTVISFIKQKNVFYDI